MSLDAGEILSQAATEDLHLVPASPAVSRLTGADHFWIAYRLAWGAWVIGALLQAALFFRPAPTGGTYVEYWPPYIGRALVLEILGIFLVSLPFLAVWLFRYRSAESWPKAAWLHRAQTAVLAIHLLLNHLDHETLRFVGTHPTVSFLRTYAHSTTFSYWAVAASLLQDEGGPGSSVLIALLPLALCVWWARRVLSTRPRRLGAYRRLFVVGLLAALLPVLVPGWIRVFGRGQPRSRRVQPYLLTLALDVARPGEFRPDGRELSKLAADHQARWLAESPDKRWRFPDPDYPYLREPLPDPAGESSTPEKPWNLICIQLETFRGWDMGLHRPDYEVSPTPFLDALARSSSAAYWDRLSSFGLMTINGFLAWNASVLPHSRDFVITTFTYTRLFSLSQALRRQGYQTEILKNADPDWDNQRLWYTRWYDRYWFYTDLEKQDRVAFRKISGRIRELGRSGRPFMFSILAASNHAPFHSSEPELDIAGHDHPSQRILNTMHYDDDVLREFFAAMEQEPWWDHTIVAIFGDHGYNLGERKGKPGQFSLYHESTWVPLILYGDHPRLPRGRHSEVASLMDLAPTIADLFGIREANPWMGHSLLQKPVSRTLTFSREETAFAETPALSMVLDPESGMVRLFDRMLDPLQTSDLRSQVPEADVQRLLGRTEDVQRLNDELIRVDRVWPVPYGAVEQASAAGQGTVSPRSSRKLR